MIATSEWNDRPFRGAAPYYVRGRLPYAASLANTLAKALGLDGQGRLLDIGCGPGVVALRLAHLFEEVVGLDIDPDMLAVSWWRFGLQNLNSVPAWRQSLFGASEMIEHYPSAALVLIAAGFEAFFIETARIRWNEAGLRKGAFKEVARQPISALVDWLPALLNMPSLRDDVALHADWKRLVNDRRNDVMHRANVHFTPDEAKESLKCAINAISFLDSFALFRPHVYYAGENY